jgi:hypothetical protein
MLNIHFYLVQPILASAVKEEVQKAELKRLNALLLVHYVPLLI